MPDREHQWQQLGMDNVTGLDSRVLAFVHLLAGLQFFADLFEFYKPKNKVN